MNPALSVIFFTTLSGAGLGLLAWLGLHHVRVPLALSPSHVLAAQLAGLVLLALGLFASAVHLGKPLRAWRGFTQWRSAWLSREAIVAVAIFAPALFLAQALARSSHDGSVRAAAALQLALALAAIVCTAKIYDTLKPIPAWHNRWVLPGYLAIGIGTGALWLLAILASSGWQPRAMQVVPLATIFIAIAALKLGYWRHIDGQSPAATTESLTGLGRIGPTRAFEAPHTEPNYLLREMGFVLARRHSSRLRAIAIAALAGVPLAAITLVALRAAPAAWLLWPALAAAMLGAFVERWLFFAEARHAVVGYYGTRGR